MTDLVPMIRLDIAHLTAFRRAVVPVLIGLGVMAWSGGMQMAAIMLYLVSMLAAINAFTMDDRYHLPLLYGGLPITRRTVVTSHYLVGAGAFLGAAALVIPLAGVSSAAHHGGVLAQTRTGFALVLATSAVVALLLPLVVQFGTRVMTYAGIGLMVAVAAGHALLHELDIVPPVAPLLRFWTDHLLATAATAAGVVALLWFASWVIACHLFTTKDF